MKLGTDVYENLNNPLNIRVHHMKNLRIAYEISLTFYGHKSIYLSLVFLCIY